MNPAIVIPDLLNDTQFHQIIITFDGLQFTSYIDKVETFKTINLNSYIHLYKKSLFLWDLWDEYKLYLSPSLLTFYKLVCYMIIFVPCGIFVVLLVLKVSSEN